MAIIGAGAAGLHCAGVAGHRGARVLLIDHATKVAEKIRISGGGRCNFTNRDCSAANFISANPAFCRSALARYTPADFIALLDRHGIGFHEKHRGQLFCDDSSERVIDMLLAQCARAGVTHWQACSVQRVRDAGAGFELHTSRGRIHAAQLVIASGGLSIPKIGASDLGYRLARQFGHRVVEPRPALVPLIFDAGDWAAYTALAGVSLQVGIATGSGRKRQHFVEDLLFTHRGLSGPAVLQISSYWQPGEAIHIELLDRQALADALHEAKLRSRRRLGNELGTHLPQRLADLWLQRLGIDAQRAIPEVADRDIARLAQAVGDWPLTPSGSEGWRKAEVTAGGVDTRDLRSQDMQSRLRPHLYFIGEVVDVTGWLGGYNFQWAWASAWACAQALRHSCAG